MSPARRFERLKTKDVSSSRHPYQTLCRNSTPRLQRPTHEYYEIKPVNSFFADADARLRTIEFEKSERDRLGQPRSITSTAKKAFSDQAMYFYESVYESLQTEYTNPEP